MDSMVLTNSQTEELLKTLQARFEQNRYRHTKIDWDKVEQRLRAKPDRLYSLFEMERTGGEPDVTDYDANTDEYLFFDCSAESPAARRSLCYDREALDARKENKPASSAEDMAEEMGVELLSEEQYRYLQTLGEFDVKTSSWICTPLGVRSRGGAMFCDRRYDHVFTYHNGADSYYAARGFRGVLKV